MFDEDNFLRYDRMVEVALRGVVKQAIEEVKDDGMLGDHRFYITFYTQFPGVKIPDYLKESYPEEMTVVLQYQFFDLEIDDEKLSVSLSFNNVPEHIVIPLEAISIFADPSVNFALQFQPLGSDDDFGFEDELLSAFDENDDESSKSKSSDKDEEESGQVVSLDQFRSKKKDSDE